jgi:hypothetical protein
MDALERRVLTSMTAAITDTPLTAPNPLTTR